MAKTFATFESIIPKARMSPDEFLKTPPQPPGPGLPLADSSTLNLKQPWGGGDHDNPLRTAHPRLDGTHSSGLSHQVD
ncbi:hypothetical protein GOBAR_DD05220 [Gossypium barbadense]|nr:hypothetical protein GOBAR_DD05220 [Gossypium barbadense]